MQNWPSRGQTAIQITPAHMEAMRMNGVPDNDQRKQMRDRFDRLMCAGWGVVLGLAIALFLR